MSETHAVRYTHETHAYQMRARKMHAYEMHVYEILDIAVKMV